MVITLLYRLLGYLNLNYKITLTFNKATGEMSDREMRPVGSFYSGTSYSFSFFFNPFVRLYLNTLEFGMFNHSVGFVATRKKLFVHLSTHMRTLPAQGRIPSAKLLTVAGVHNSDWYLLQGTFLLGDYMLCKGVFAP